MTKTKGPLSLRRRLRQGFPLAKDREAISSSEGRLHRFEARDRIAERAILYALTGKSGTRAERRRALEIANCSPEHRCGSWVCYVCRHLQWRREREAIAPHALRVGDADLEISFATIVAGTTHGKSVDVRKIVMDSAQKVHEVLSRWPSVAAQGRFEIDCHRPGEVSGTFKTRTLMSCGYRPSSNARALVPHLHVVIVHPGIRREAIRYFLRKSFPGDRRVQVKGLRESLPLETNLDNLVRYQLKFGFPKHAISDVRSRPPTTNNVREVARFYRLLDRLGGLNGPLKFNHNISV